MRRLVLTTSLALLVAAVPAHAKGTNIRISSAPHGTDAGEQWHTLITVSMPGNGRLSGVRPRMVIRKGSERKVFKATPTKRTGVYRVAVVFPSRGTWKYGVNDDLDRFEPGAGRLHGFPPVAIGANTSPRSTPPLPISGEVDEDMVPGGGTGVVPPEVTISKPASDGDDDGSFPMLALLIPPFAIGGGLLWRQKKGRP